MHLMEHLVSSTIYAIVVFWLETLEKVAWSLQRSSCRQSSIMRFSSKSRATCFYCISLDLLICIIFYGDQITCRCWGRQSADARHTKSKSGATNLHGAGASNLTDNIWIRTTNWKAVMDTAFIPAMMMFFTNRQKDWFREKWDFTFRAVMKIPLCV